MSAELTQNELFQFLGNYPPMPDEVPNGAGSAAGPEGELVRLAESVKTNGIHRTAAVAGAFASPVIRLYLRLLDSGLPPAMARSFVGVAFIDGHSPADGTPVSGVSLESLHGVFEP